MEYKLDESPELNQCCTCYVSTNIALRGCQCTPFTPWNKTMQNHNICQYKMQFYSFPPWNSCKSQWTMKPISVEWASTNQCSSIYIYENKQSSETNQQCSINFGTVGDNESYQIQSIHPTHLRIKSYQQN